METLSTQFIRTPQVQIVSTVPSRSYWECYNLRAATEGRSELKEQLRALFHGYMDIIPQNDDDLGQTTLLQHSIHTSIATPIRSQPRRLLFLDDTLDTLVGACWVSIWIMQCTSNLPMPCWIGFKGTPLVNILGLVLPFSKECKLCRSYHIQWRSENRPRIGYSC